MVGARDKVFNSVIKSLDVAMRVYMRGMGLVSPKRVGETLFGFRMYCDTRDFIQRRVYYFKIYEPNLTYYIKQNIHPGDHAIDVGANVGYITLLLSRLVGPSGKVTAIEAHPATYHKLSENLKLNTVENVTALNIAATDGPCSVEIVTGEKNNSGSNSVRKMSGREGVLVNGDALSNLSEIERDKITLIKIDIEGSEAPVLRDLLANLEAFPALRVIAAEISPETGDLFSSLIAHGFRAYAFPNNYLIGYLFVRHYLRQSSEHEFVVKIPVDGYHPEFRDYVFERAEIAHA